MKHGSLFSGIGGFDLAAEWMGWENIFQCEIDDYCNKLLKQNFPNTAKHGNIKETDFTIYRGGIDILSGGFPCQPYSTAGKRLGKEDERHLWPEMLRAIHEISPKWVVGENVRGLTNWNGGVVFDEVQSDLEAEGYEVLPFLLPAAGVNAPHRRDRIWFIAHACSAGSTSSPQRIDESRELFQAPGWLQDKQLNQSFGESGIIANSKGITQRESTDKANTFAESGQTRIEFSCSSMQWADKRFREDFPTQSPVCRGNDGVSHRLDRIKGLENAVVPQVVYQIFKAIELYEDKSVQEVQD